jgi:hypothetical protein
MRHAETVYCWFLAYLLPRPNDGSGAWTPIESQKILHLRHSIYGSSQRNLKTREREGEGECGHIERMKEERLYRKIGCTDRRKDEETRAIPTRKQKTRCEVHRVRYSVRK